MSLQPEQLKTKWLKDGSVDGTKIKIKKNQSIKGTKQDGSEVELLKLNASDKIEVLGSEIAVKADVQAEALARQSADAVLSGQIASEFSLREAGDIALEGKIQTEKERIDAILLASNADKDSFAEIVSLINSVDTQNDNVFSAYALSNNAKVSALESGLAQEILDRQAGDAQTLVGAKAYTDAQIDLIPPVDLTPYYTKTEVDAKDLALSVRITALETYDQETVFVDSVNGVDESGRGSMMKPFKTINYAYSQVESLGNQSNTSYNSNVEKFVTEKLVIHLAPGRYNENVVLGFKRARVRLTGDGATIIGNVKMSVKLADFPCASLENLKNSFPSPYTGASAFMNFELAGKSGGGIESDPAANVLVVTGLVSLAFEETTVPGSGVVFPNWDGSFGQFYAYMNSVSIGNFVVTTSHNAATPTLPSGVIELESCNMAATASTYRMHFGIVPYSYLSDFATWSVATKGSTNKAPTGTWTLKAHNSTLGNVIGPRLVIGEIDGCRIYDIDRTMRGTVDNGAVSGSTSTSYIGVVNTQFRIFSGSGDLASAYKLGQASGSTRYKLDSVSYTTLAFSRNSSGVLSVRTLDVGAGVNYDFLDDARSIFVNDPANNYTRALNTVDSALEGIDTALGLKANQSSISSIESNVSSLQSGLASEISRAQAAEAQVLVDAKAYTDSVASSKASVSYVDTQDAAKLVEAKSYADSVVASEASAREAADSVLAAAIEANKIEFGKSDKTLLGADAFVDLDHKVIHNSLIVFCDCYPLHLGTHYTASDVNGKTRLTFIGYAAPGEIQEFEAGEVIHATYAKA